MSETATNEEFRVKKEEFPFMNYHFTCATENLEEYICGNCAYSTPFKLLFDKHTQTPEHQLPCEPLASYSCPECDSFYSHSFLVLIKHKYAKCRIREADRRQEVVVWYKCGQCVFKSVRRSEVQQHSKAAHLSENVVCECQYCDHKTRTYCGMKSHIRNRHVVGKDFKWFECVQCPFKTKVRSNVEQHTKTHKKKEFRFKCGVCEYKTHRHDRWKHHQILHVSKEEIEWFQCDRCSFKAKCKRYLQKHVAVKHIDPSRIKYIQCDFCPYKNRWRGNVRNHVISKHRPEEKELVEKRFRCDRCAYKTNHGFLLKEHTNAVHTAPENIQWFECDKCSYRSKSKGNLTKHLKTRHAQPGNVVLVKCEFCDYEAKHKLSLKYHVATQHVDKVEADEVKCDRCEYSTRWPDNLRKHAKNVH